MPYECEHCDSVFANKPNLIKHQRTAQYCLELQGKTGEVKKLAENNVCTNCKCSFSTKGNLTRHIKNCTVINQKAVSITNIAGNQINNINITVNTGYCISDLTQAHIMSILEPVITKQIVGNGMGAITEVIIETLLQKDGKYIYYCTDRSRSKFMMVVNHDGELIAEHDPESMLLRGIISAPLRRIVLPIAMKHEDDESIQKAFGQVKNLRNDSELFNRDMTYLLPPSSDGCPEGIRAVFDEGLAAIDEISAKEQKWEEKKERSKKLKIEEKKQIAYDQMLDSCDKRADNLYWDRVYHHVVKFDGNSLEIIGYAGKKDDKLMNLSKSQVSAVRDRGLGQYLGPQYKI